MNLRLTQPFVCKLKNKNYMATLEKGPYNKRLVTMPSTSCSEEQT